MQDAKSTNAGGQFKVEKPKALGSIMGEKPETFSKSGTQELLRDYDTLKLDLASSIQAALRLVNQESDRESHHRLRDLLTKLAEDRFVLAVVGQFSRGKSSLMNALMGLDRLPIGIVPLTSVVTKVSYGNPERVWIEYPNSFLRGEIPLGKLADYVTETGNPGNQRGIAAAEVQLPSEFLRRGVCFVDTPGVGSAIRANTQTTRQFLPQADAVVFVTAFDSPLGREEVDFLREVREHVRKIFIVVNKLDLVPPGERDHVLTFIRERLENEAGIDDPKLFAVSSLNALRAKLAGSTDALMQSGLASLEENLIHFLTTGKTAELLIRTCDRAIASIAEIDPPVVVGNQAAAWNGVIKSLDALRCQLTEGPKLSLSHSSREARAIPEADLMRAVRKPCQVCAKVADGMFKFMAKFQYQVIMDENERKILAARGGLCPLHTWQYAEIASPQGISAAYPAVLASVSQRLTNLAAAHSTNDLWAGTRNLLTGVDKCRACQEQLALERKALEDIERKMTPADGDQSAPLPVLCLQHLSDLLQMAPKSERAADLIEFEAALFERLAENMRRYALKHDALRRGTESEDERVAYHRGLSQLAGDKRLQSPWRVERLI
jgi:GTP-binding protein EngB required for normal cell division